MPSQSRAAAITSSSVLHCAVASSTPAPREELALEIEVGEIVVGEQDLGMSIGASFGETAEAGDAQRYVAPATLVKWPDRIRAASPAPAPL